MDKLSVFQKNNLFTGTNLAIELPASASDRRAFLVIGAYTQTSRGAVRPSTVLNVDQSDLRFWIRKYEIERSYLETDLDITDHDFIDSVYLNNIQSLEELEFELGRYIQDLSSLENAVKVSNPFP